MKTNEGKWMTKKWKNTMKEKNKWQQIKENDCQKNEWKNWIKKINKKYE